MTDQFIGAGWAFPLRTTAAGGIALVTGEREIVESIRLILATAPGERPMRPDFGCGIHDYVFAPADEDTAGRIAFEVRTALDRWEPRIDVTAVTIEFDDDDTGVLYIDIQYTIRNDNDPRNLVFPFYVIPDEGTAVAGDGIGELAADAPGAGDLAGAGERSLAGDLTASGRSAA